MQFKRIGAQKCSVVSDTYGGNTDRTNMKAEICEGVRRKRFENATGMKRGMEFRVDD